MRGEVEIVRTDADQAWHVRLRANSGEPISSTEQLERPLTAFENVLAQARTFGYDVPRLVRVSETEALLWSGMTIAGHPLEREYVIAVVRTVDERAT
jgi:hypothetical protein